VSTRTRYYSSWGTDGFVVAEHGSGMTVTGRLPAELNIFATLLPEILREWKQPPYWAIGVSELMCVGCYAMLAKAFPKVLSQHENIHGLASLLMGDPQLFQVG
jgi:hypothetical protein